MKEPCYGRHYLEPNRLDCAEVNLEMPKSAVKGLLIGLNRAIEKERKDKCEGRLKTTDNKVVLIKNRSFIAPSFFLKKISVLYLQ